MITKERFEIAIGLLMDPSTIAVVQARAVDTIHAYAEQQRAEGIREGWNEAAIGGWISGPDVLRRRTVDDYLAEREREEVRPSPRGIGSEVKEGA